MMIAARGKRYFPKLALAFFIVLAIVTPLYANLYTLRVFTQIFMFGALSLSWNLLGGYAGYISFGNVAFFGIGAYTFGALMTKLHLGFFPSMIAGGVMAAVFALAIGHPLLRLKGHYFAVATFGIAEAIRGLASLDPMRITGGGKGMTLPIVPGDIRSVSALFYFTMFGLMLACAIVTYLITRSRIGYGLLAIREDEDAAAAIGICTSRYKTLAYVVSALFTGFTGAVYGYWMTYIEPADAFHINISISMVIMALLGGRGTIMGPIIGAFLLELLTELVWRRFLEFHALILGIIIIVVVLFIPKGFMELKQQGRRMFSPSFLIDNMKKYKV